MSRCISHLKMGIVPASHVIVSFPGVYIFTSHPTCRTGLMMCHMEDEVQQSDWNHLAKLAFFGGGKPNKKKPVF